MKNEAEFNSVVSRSLNLNGFGFKIPDTVSITTGVHGDLPFDGFGLFKDKNGKGYPVYFESKYLREPMSFNFHRLEDHQIESLLKCKEVLPDCLALFLICVDFGRADKRVFFFKDMDYINQRKIDKKNILKKEFLKRKNYVKISKGVFDFNNIIESPKELEYEI